MAADTKRIICAFVPQTSRYHPPHTLPRGRLILHSDGTRTLKLRTQAGHRRRVVIKDAEPFDADLAREWLEAWEFARVCATHLRASFGAPRYKITADADSRAHLNSLRARTEQQFATPPSTHDARLTIRRAEPTARILDEPPSPDLITTLVLESKLYRYIFYTPPSRTVQQGAMAPALVIPEEVHADAEQYFLVKAGHGWSVVDGRASELSTTSAFWVYRGQSHAIVSDPRDPLQLFTSYSPAHHPAGRINQNNVDVLEQK